MMTVSLRRAALSWMTGLLTVVGFVTIVVAYLYARGEAAEFLDSQLRQIALNAGTGMPFGNAPAAADQDPEDQFAITIWDAKGRVAHQSLPSVQIARQAQPGFANVKAGGELWRVYTTSDSDRTVLVAQRDTVLAEIADSAALGATAPILIMIPLSWLVVGWAMNRVLGRLDELANAIAERSVSATEPIPLAGVPVEVTPLVESMNGFIVRLRAAAETQKRFLADAAHELRTPLAAMQIQVDNLASGGPGPQDERVAALAAGVKRASLLVDQLLRLARLDEPIPAHREAFDVGALLLECVGDCVPLADRKGLDIGVNAGSPVTSRGIEGEVRVLFANLIENAIRYTPSGGKIDVLLDHRDGQLIVKILDTGTGLPKGAEARIFDRFYRGAPQEGKGAGLGLAIARRIAERHAFDLTVENRADGVAGVVARVTMPAEASTLGHATS
ncbi:two-component sensor histidine kinase (plasmid) [Methylocystis heyeri]|uniref:histidine kinase n=1 Tax=Methylocystis heyeri TaxID=391905 RepID=A0A6B8KL26_9HYPH|nr:two-component sensor histidine kinase [Methylocystis heyeri]